VAILVATGLMLSSSVVSAETAPSRRPEKQGSGIGGQAIEWATCLPDGVGQQKVTSEQIRKDLLDLRLFDEWSAEVSSLAGSKKILAIAMDFVRYGYYAMSCAVVQPLLASEVQTDTYSCAALLSGEIRKMVYCPSPDPVGSAKRDLPSLPSNVRPVHAYLTAKDLFEEQGDMEGAEKLLREVHQDTSEYRKAQFLLGVIDFSQEKYQTATEEFVRAIGNSKWIVDGIHNDEFSILNLARIAYTNNFFAKAVHFYEQIPPESPLWLRSSYERASALLALGRFDEALGAVVALESHPKFRWEAFPDIALLRAEVYVQNCQFVRASKIVLDAQIELIKELEDLSLLDKDLAEVRSETRGPLETKATSIKPDSIRRILERTPILSKSPTILKSYRYYLRTRQERKDIEEMDIRLIDLVTRNALFRSFFGKRDRHFADMLVKEVESHRQELVDALNDMELYLSDLESQKIKSKFDELKEITESPRKAFLMELIGKQRGGDTSMEMRAFVSKVDLKGKVRLIPSDLDVLEAKGVPEDVLDYISKLLVNADSGLSSTDLAGGDRTLVLRPEGEVWLSERNSLRVEIPNLCAPEPIHLNDLKGE